MKIEKTLVTAFILIIISLSSFSQTQFEMNKESSETYLKLEQELKNVYNQIITEYKNDSIFIDKLKNSQQLWVKFRDAEVEMLFPEPDKRIYGSMYSMCYIGYLSELTKVRIAELEEWLKPIPKGEGCRGSKKYRKIIKKDGATEMIDTNQKLIK